MALPGPLSKLKIDPPLPSTFPFIIIKFFSTTLSESMYNALYFLLASKVLYPFSLVIVMLLLTTI